MAFDAGALVARLRLDAKGFRAGVQQATGQMDGMEKQALGLSKTLGTTLAVGALGALAFGFIKTVDAAGKFEKSMANVSTLVDTATVDIEGLSDAVLDMTTEVTKSAEDLSAGLYQVFSAGVTDAAEAMSVLEVSAVAATAGLADTRSSVDAITTILNAYGLEAREATNISDLMFQTVKLGKTTFTELAGSIGTVIAPAAALGIKLEDLFSALATLTKGGFDTRTATTALRATFLSILKPTDEARETAKQLGIKWTANALKAKGLVTFLNEVKEVTGGNTEAMAKLIPETRALNAALALTGAQSGELNKILGEMEDSLGATQEAFKKQEDTYDAQSQKLGLLVDRIQIKIGRVFIPAINAMLKSTLNFFDVVGQEFDALKAKLSAPLPAGGFQALGKQPIATLTQMKIAAKEIGTAFEKLTTQDMPKFESKLKELFGVTMPKLTAEMKKQLDAIGNRGVAAAEGIRKAWFNLPTDIETAFETLGVLSKQQFFSQVETATRAFEEIVNQQELSDEEILKLREQLFQKINSLADQAGGAATLGFDPEEFKAKLAEVHQALLDSSTVTMGEILTVGDTTKVLLVGMARDAKVSAANTIAALEGLINNAGDMQKNQFDSLIDQIETYQSAYIAAEEAITDVVVEQTEARSNIIERFVDGVLQQFTRLPIAGLGGTQFGPEGEFMPPTSTESPLPFFTENSSTGGSAETNNNISQTVNINNPGGGSVEQGQDMVRQFNKMNASLAF